MQELLRIRLGSMTAVAAFASVAFFALRFLAAALERSGRIRAVTSSSERSLRTDLGYMLLSPLMEVLSKTFSTFTVVACALLVGRRAGPELLEGFGPVIRQPRWLIVLEMLVLSDFVYYWVHRAAHTFAPLWRLHAVHHSTQHMRWTSALRAHPAEVYLHLVTVVPLFLLGFPVDGLAPLAPFITLYAFLIHADSNVSMRRVSYFANSPMYHGWHHALDAKDGGVNFAGFFPLFDALFGTYRLPAERPAAVGIDDTSMPETCVAQLKYAFRSEPEPSQRMDLGRAHSTLPEARGAAVSAVLAQTAYGGSR